MIRVLLLAGVLAAAAPEAARADEEGRAGAPAAPQVTGVRFWSGPDHTRVVLDVSAPVAFTDSIGEGGLALSLLLDGAVLAPGARGLSIGDGAVRTVTLGQSDGAVLVRVRLDRPAVPSVFPLDPLGGRPHRIVIDVPREAPPEPVLPRTRRIVIDPGHGGEDWGTQGLGGTVEKEITLDVSQRIARRLAEGASDGDHAAVLTRESDTFVPLPERVRLAREAGAALFVSVHANSSPDPSGHGAEIYFVSLEGATDVAAQELADKENAALVAGVPTAEAKEEAIASEDLLGILVDLRQSDTIARSSLLAESVVEALRAMGDVPVRGIKQAEFQVLKSVVVPSILVELGFVTHEGEARRLQSPERRERLAEGIARGIERFLAAEEEGALLREHVVAAGETLSGLAREHGLSAEDLARLNGIAVGPLRAGQRIRVPR